VAEESEIQQRGPALQLPGFNVLAKATGPICNMDCKYCFYLEKEKLYPETRSWSMPDDVLETFIRQYIEGQQTQTINFVWQGGEPTLLGVHYFKKIVELQKKYANGKRIENAIQTNGILLNDLWAEFLVENRFLVGISIDGPKELHDCYRVNKGGSPTFDKVLEGLECLKRYQVEFNTLTVVHRKNANHPLEVYNFLKAINSRFMQFIPLVQRLAEAPDKYGLLQPGPEKDEAATVSEWSVRPYQFGDFLCEIFDEWVRNDVGRYYVQVFDVALESWLGVPQSICVYRPTCGEALAIEHTGDVYSCDHYVYPENRLGNIMDQPLASLVASEQQRAFGEDKAKALPRYCQQCEVRFACNGECPRNRFEKTPDGEYGLNYLCVGYKKFFMHVDPYMRFMATELREQRAPANIMEKFHPTWKKGKATSPAVGRNDPCPCGSGKKYKKCCGPIGGVG
jgi:anaerobic sulfatase-maturating enzyme